MKKGSIKLNSLQDKERVLVSIDYICVWVVEDAKTLLQMRGFNISNAIGHLGSGDDRNTIINRSSRSRKSTWHKITAKTGLKNRP